MDARPPQCPRCAYDLSGAVAAWPGDRCPCEGICSECGLTTLWRDVLSPVYATNELFFETAERKTGRAFFRTLWQGVRPWRLWRVAQMQFAVSPRRLAVFVVLGVALLWLVGTIAMGLLGYLGSYVIWSAPGRWLPKGWYEWTWLLKAALWPYQAGGGWYQSVPPWIVLGSLWLLGSLFMWRLVPSTLRFASVRRSHILRIWMYSAVGLPLLVYVPAIAFWTIGVVPWLRSLTGLAMYYNGERVALVILIAWGGWLVVCWGSGAKHYLRLERPWMVAGVLVFVSGLALVTLAVLIALASHDAMAWMMNAIA